MHLTAYCPSCHSRYQLDVSLRGQRIRCPNPVCREVFEVQDAEPEPGQPRPTDAGPPKTGGEPPTDSLDVEPSDEQRQRRPEMPPAGTVASGSVGDLVPIL